MTASSGCGHRTAWVGGARRACRRRSLLPWVLPEGGLLGSLVITGILFIALIGLDVLMGYAGQVSLGQAGFMAIGGYTAGCLAVQYDVAPLLGILARAACSLGSARWCWRWSPCGCAASIWRSRRWPSGCCRQPGRRPDDITGGPSGLVGIPSFSVGSLDFGTPLRMYYLVLGIIAVVAGAARRRAALRLRPRLQAIRTDQTAAAALGINVPLYKLAAFAISAVLASLAGSLYAFDFHFLSPEMVGTRRSLELVAMMVIGGEGTLVGPLLGAVLLTLLPTVVPAAVRSTRRSPTARCWWPSSSICRKACSAAWCAGAAPGGCAAARSVRR